MKIPPVPPSALADDVARNTYKQKLKANHRLVIAGFKDVDVRWYYKTRFNNGKFQCPARLISAALQMSDCVKHARNPAMDKTLRKCRSCLFDVLHAMHSKYIANMPDDTASIPSFPCYWDFWRATMFKVLTQLEFAVEWAKDVQPESAHVLTRVFNQLCQEAELYDPAKPKLRRLPEYLDSLDMTWMAEKFHTQTGTSVLDTPEAATILTRQQERQAWHKANPDPLGKHLEE